jgi:S-adenosyl methyltransferase
VSDEGAPAGVDSTRPNAARMYDYYLGGKDNFAAYRAAVARFFGDWPLIDPGLVELWPYPTLPDTVPEALEGTIWSGVARKP